MQNADFFYQQYQCEKW